MSARNANAVSAGRDVFSVAWLVLRETVRSFPKNNNFQVAATLAYYGFFSLTPLLLLVLILLGRFTLSSREVLEGISSITQQVLPQFNEVILKEISALAVQRTWGWVSMAALLWAVTPLSSSLRAAFTQIFRSERKHNFLQAKLYTLAGAGSILSLFVILVASKLAIGLWEGTVSAPAGIPEWKWLAFAVSFPVGVLFIVLLTFVFCPVRLSWFERLAGALVTASLLFVIRPLFALVLRFNPNYGYAFGSLKAIFLLTVWIYYSFVVILLGAELMANLRRRDALLLRGLFLAARPRTGEVPGPLRRFLRLCAEGETIFREGAAGSEMYYVVSGRVKIEKNGKPVREYGPGEYFGEMAMLLDESRTASATGSAPETNLIAISRSNFDTLLRDNPSIVTGVLKEMARRLQVTTAQL
jgi:membrane protein